MKKIIPAILLFALAAYGVAEGFIWLLDNKIPNFREEGELFVRPGMGPEDVAAQLEGNVRRERSLMRTFEKKQVATYITPGHYVVRPGHTSVYVARMLNNGWQTPVRLTLSGTLRLRGEIARKISSQMMADSAEVRAAMEDKALLSEFGFTPETVFALFVPDTYEMYWTASVKDILARQKKALDEFWTKERDAKAKALKLDRLQVAIVASIVCGESNYLPEYPKIAGVYLNRLSRGMKLQADPTVAFCFDYDVRRILKSQLKVDSPYNTYVHAGLPPGPIYIPSKAALDAVLNPDRGGGNLYFCADPSFNGSHRFAKTYDEHRRNARAFQRALDAKSIKN
jgi:UPF0755 protein